MNREPDSAPRRKILVVDDDETLATTVAALLQDAGFETAVAHDGAAGLALARKMDPDVVVLDIMMPTLDGFEVCRQFKEMWGSDRPKIIILSGITSGVKTDVNQLLQQTLADAFLVKPCPTQELIAAVYKLLARAAKPK